MNPDRNVAAAGFILGALLGFAGGLVPAGILQDSFWLVSSLGLVVGCLLAARWQHDRPLAAAGFFLLAGAEMLIHAGGSRGTDPGAPASFAAGLAFYVPALLLIAAAARIPIWLRGVTAAASIPFAIHVAQRLAGSNVGATNLPATIGYGMLTIAVLGWAWCIARPVPGAPAAPKAQPRGV